MRQVAALFVRGDSIYKTMPGVDCYDIERDARTWPGGCPVVAHPPCRAWGRLRQFAQPREGERELGPWAVEQVRRWGGVLEHPAESTLFATCELPLPRGRLLPRPGPWVDDFGGITLAIRQFDFGHRAEKMTWLYVVGCPTDFRWPDLRLDQPTHCIRPTKSYPRLPSVTKAEREHTPPALAHWLVDLARRCVVNREREAA